MFSVIPVSRDAGEGFSWEGTVSSIRRHINEARVAIGANLNRKLKDI